MRTKTSDGRTFLAGVDVGGTKVAAIVADRGGRQVGRAVRSMAARPIGVEPIVDAIRAALKAAQSLADNPPKVTTLCIDVSGRSLPATCRVPGSRLDSREDICTCGPGAQQVTASVCPVSSGVMRRMVTRRFSREGPGVCTLSCWAP